MTRIVEKRASLHRILAEQQEENKALRAEVTQLEALANVGSISYMIAHEINNLLTPLANYAALAMQNPQDRALAEKVLEKTVQNCERASKIMASMLAVADGQGQEKQDARLSALVEEIFACLCRDFAKDGITVRIHVPEDFIVWVVPVQIQQVLMNLILNARDAMLPGGGVLTIRATARADVAQIEVSDTGTGIDPDDLMNIFDSFFTTKRGTNAAGRYCGAGLGLAYCRKIVDAHGGSISVESMPGEGSTFKITLPKRRSGKS